MPTEPVAHVIPRLPNDPQISAEDDPKEFLIGLLDWVGDQVVPGVSCEHISDDLLGCWSLYQLLSFHMPPYCAVDSLEFVAEQMDLQDMRQAAKEAAVAISNSTDSTAKQEVFERSILSVPVADWRDLAFWVEQNIRTALLPDRDAWDTFHRDIGEKLREDHPSFWRAKHKENEAKARVAKLFRQQLEAAKKAR